MSPNAGVRSVMDAARTGLQSLALAIPAARRGQVDAEMRRAGCTVSAVSLPPAVDGDALASAPAWSVRGSRLARRIRTRGAVIELVLVDARLAIGTASWPWLRLEMHHMAGARSALPALAQRWVQRFGLVLDPFTLDEQVQRLLSNDLPVAPRAARRPAYAPDASADAAFEAVVDECLAQVLDNAAMLAASPPCAGPPQVHQLRVGIRRLRSALRVFRAWVDEPPEPLEAGLRVLFQALGTTRDAEVFATGVGAELASAGAPPLAAPFVATGQDADRTARAVETQTLLLQWMDWRATRQASLAADSKPPKLERRAARRLGRWHQRLATASAAFDTLDEEALHDLRKAVKRQRYAVEFLAPLLRRRRCARYLTRLAAVQERLGHINDLLVARAGYQSVTDREPGAWFALGWLAARIAEARIAARPALKKLADVPLPWA